MCEEEQMMEHDTIDTRARSTRALQALDLSTL
jgi:hypothetical protein